MKIKNRRLILVLLLNLLISGISAQQWQFDTGGDFEGWIQGSESYFNEYLISDGNLHIEGVPGTGAWAWIYNPYTSFGAEKYQVLEIRLRKHQSLTTFLDFSWIKDDEVIFSTANKQTFQYNNTETDDFVTYSFTLDDEDWGGNITSIRLDPLRSPTLYPGFDFKCDIDYIKLIDTIAPVLSLLSENSVNANGTVTGKIDSDGYLYLVPDTVSLDIQAIQNAVGDNYGARVPAIKDESTVITMVGLKAGSYTLLATNSSDVQAESYFPITLTEDNTESAINVVVYGVDDGGTSDNTVLLTQLHGSGKPIYYPNGKYLFNGKYLCLDGGVNFETENGVTIFNHISDQNILVFDNFGNLIGLQQNHLELNDKNSGDRYKMDVGSLVRPPVSTANFNTAVDFLPHWYNDFGLESKRLGTYDAGSLTWYYWSWNFHNAGDYYEDEYDPSLHPLLGFYRGDDPVVLDWQCYWLRQYGVKGVILYSNYNSYRSFDEYFSIWNNPASRNHWVYQLFHHVPNFNGLRYVMTMPSDWIPVEDCTPSFQEKFKSHWFSAIDKFYFQYDNFYSIERGEQIYPVVYVHQEAAIRGILDHYQGYTNTLNLYREVADYFQQKGYGGVAIFSRSYSEMGSFSDLSAEGILHYSADYSISNIESLKTQAVNPDKLLDEVNQFTFSDLANAYRPNSNPDNIVNIFVNAHTHTPHPSEWYAPGMTPDLFSKILDKAISAVEFYDKPKVITGYNMAEWSEGSASFQPDVERRFTILEALYEALTGFPFEVEDYKSSPNDFLKIYPNPVKNYCQIDYELNSQQEVLIEVYNLQGKKVETILLEVQLPGMQRVTWNRTNHISGLYLFRIVLHDYTDITVETIKVIIE